MILACSVSVLLGAVRASNALAVEDLSEIYGVAFTALPENRTALALDTRSSLRI